MDNYPPQPPQGYPQQQYQPQPPPFQPPPFQPAAFQPPGPPQRGSNTGLLIGGVVTAAIICAAVGIGFLKGSRVASAFGGQSRLSKAQQSSAVSTLMTLNAQIQLYRLQHMDNLPDFRRYPSWEQLTQYSDASGRLSRAKTPQAYFGPYIQSAPVNPFNKLSSVTTYNGVQPGQALPGGQKAGFVMDGLSGRVWMTDASGSKVASLQGLY